MRRKFPLRKNLKLAIKKLYDFDKKNDNEVDFDEQKQKRTARGMTFSKWIAQYKADVSSWHLKPLEDFFGTKLLTAIDDTAVEKYREKRSAEKVIRHGKQSKKSYRRQLSTKRGEQPSKLLRMARNKGIHDKVTAFPIEKEHSRKRRLTDEEYNNCWKIARHG